MSGQGKQKALARRLESQLKVEGLEPSVNFGCSCRTLQCEPRVGIGAPILRIPLPDCVIHFPRKSWSQMTGAELLKSLTLPS